MISYLISRSAAHHDSKIESGYLVVEFFLKFNMGVSMKVNETNATAARKNMRAATEHFD